MMFHNLNSRLPGRFWKNETGRFLSFLRKCEEMLEINSNDEDALFSKGTVLAKLERYEESIDCLGRLTELDPR